MTAAQLYELAGTFDYWQQYYLPDGVVYPDGHCGPLNPNPWQWSWNCAETVTDAIVGSFPACMNAVANGPVAPAGGLPLGALPGNLAAQMRQSIFPGQMTTLPQQPNPGLVNIGTCFFINGVSIEGQNPMQGQTFQLVLLRGPDASGRFLYYVFRLQLHLDTANPIVWDFGDQSSQTDLTLPPQCDGPATAPQT